MFAIESRLNGAAWCAKAWQLDVIAGGCAAHLGGT
jgi:hypothetical protein